MMSKSATFLAAAAFASIFIALAPDPADAKRGQQWWMGSPGAYAYIAPRDGWTSPRYHYLGLRHYPPYDAKSPVSGAPDATYPPQKPGLPQLLAAIPCMNAG